MKINAVSSTPSKQTNVCVVAPLHSGKSLSGIAAHIDGQSGRAITRALKRGDASPELAKSVMLFELPDVAAELVLLVGAAKPNQSDRNTFRRWCHSVAKTLNDSAVTTAIIHLEKTLYVEDESTSWHACTLASALMEAQYSFNLHSKEKAPKPALQKCSLVVTKSEVKEASSGAKTGAALADGIALARDLGNLAGNICTPSYLAKKAQSMAKQHATLRTTVVNEAQMEKLGMGAFLSVSRGSPEPGKLICMHYKGTDSKKKPIVLLGKGVTFDSGGISIKPSAAMDEMKFDMCGAATVFGTMHAICALAPKRNVIAVIAAAENMPDGNASKPGDVVTTMSGQTVEILNTDAEGRLVMCDALTYIERFKPDTVIDVATLTGACIVALGHHSSAVMSNDDGLAHALVEAGQITGDYVWHLPMWDEYQAQLDSNFADIANIGGSAAGAITAGCFLSRFAEKFRWAHLDIAGVAWRQGKQKNATGRPVSCLLEFVLHHS